MKVGDLVNDDAKHIGIITKYDYEQDWVWVEMRWQYDSHGFQPLPNMTAWTGWYNALELEIYHESR